MVYLVRTLICIAGNVSYPARRLTEQSIEHRTSRMQTPTCRRSITTRRNTTGPSADEVLRAAQAIPEPRHFSLLQKADHARGRQDAICLGRNGQALSRRARRHRDHQRRAIAIRTLSTPRNKQNETLQHSTTIYLHPNIADLRREAGLENAGRSEGLLLRQLRFGSERSRVAHGARLHRQLRHDRVAQCLSRRQRLRHGADRASAPGNSMSRTVSASITPSRPIRIAVRGAATIPMPAKNMPPM